MLAYVDRGQCPPFMLSVLAIQESHENNPSSHIIDDMRTALLDLSETAKKDEVKIGAARALDRLPSSPIAAAPEIKKANEEAVAEVGIKAADAVKEASSTRTQTTAKTQLTALAPTLATIAVSNENRALQQRARTALAEADPEAARRVIVEAAANLSPEQKKTLPPRVYLHIASEGQRETARLSRAR